MDQEKREQHEAKEELANEELKAQFARSYAWKLVKDSLIAKLVDMDSVSATIESLTKKEKPLDEIKDLMYTNGKAVEIVVDWINGIETMGGIINANFKQEINDRKKEQVIVTLPEQT